MDPGPYIKRNIYIYIFTFPRNIVGHTGTINVCHLKIGDMEMEGGCS